MIKFLLTLLFTTICLANSVSWYGSYDKAFTLAQKEKKNLMILIVSTKNNKSNEILKNCFQNKNYIDYLNKNYINILVNVDYKISYPIELFYTTKFPSLFFASYKDETFLVNPIYDLKDKKEIISILKKLENIKKP